MAAPRTGPFVVSVIEVQRSVGSQRADTIRGHLDGLAISDASIAPTTEIEADLVVESTAHDEVTVTGRLTAPYQATCRRCLGPADGVVDLAIREVFQARPVEGETYLFTRDWLDLEPMVRDALVLALPVAALCRPDCPGPDPDDFPVEIEDSVSARTSDGPGASGTESEPPRDPRWAALDALRPDP